MRPMWCVSSRPIFVQVLPPSVDLKAPSPHEELCRLLASPEPTHTMDGSDGARVMSPIVGTLSLSKSGSQVVPAFVVFHTPPEAMPTKTILGSLSTTAKSSTRPPMMAGPNSRNCRPFSASTALAGSLPDLLCALRRAKPAAKLSRTANDTTDRTRIMRLMNLSPLRNSQTLFSLRVGAISKDCGVSSWRKLAAWPRRGSYHYHSPRRFATSLLGQTGSARAITDAKRVPGVSTGLRTTQDLETFGLRRGDAARVDGFNINVAGKVFCVEGQNVFDAMHVHSRHQARVMNLCARDALCHE